jgi:alpha-galactosidase
MSKITLIGAGSAVFSKRLLGDCMLTPGLQGFELALYDINEERLRDCERIISNLKLSLGSSCTVKAYSDRKEALRGAKFVINTILVGGDEGVRTDFRIPNKYNLGQTVADTVSIGGLFRNLRTIPVMLDIARDMQEVCPNALMLNYSNPMSVVTTVMNVYGGISTVGLCHSVQGCVPHLFRELGMDAKGVRWKIAGINHMAWLLEVTKDGVDLYPEVKRRAAEKQKTKHNDMVRYEIMLKFGYYPTESSKHHAEYHPYFIKRSYPELTDKYNIPLDFYVGRREELAAKWNSQRDEMLNSTNLTHTRSHEYGSYIMNAVETNESIEIAGNVMNTGGLISNLPKEACVEVPCVINARGVTPTYFGDLPPQLAALNRTHINTHLLTIEAAMTGKKEHIYHAAMLDPHTAAELSLDDIVSLCDELIEAHSSYLPKFS